MVGNDVVDLADADVRAGARHPRFEQRAFAPCERRRIEVERAGGPLRWILWAAKESAYKVAKRLDATTVFSPARFVVELDDSLRGRVWHGDDAYPVQVTRRGDCLHAIATEPGGAPENVVAGVRRLAGAETGDCEAAAAGREARAFAVAEIAPRLAVSADSLIVSRRGRIPQLHHRDGREAAALSLSHHGRFVAYACALAQPRGESSQ